MSNPRRRSVLRSSRRTAGDGGFTLVEIAFAVLILSSALVTILGLQSAIIRRTIATQNTHGAMLIARRILAVIETTDEPIEVGEETKLADEMMQQFLGTGGAVAADDDQGKFYTAHMAVSYWPIPKVAPDALKRILLDIWRSELPDDRFSIVFFIPNEDSSVDEEPG